MIPSAKIAIRPSPPPENRFSSPRMLAAAEVLLDRVDRGRVDARRRDVRPEPVEAEDRRGEQDLVADLADPERLRGSSRSSRPARLASTITWQVPPAASICSRAAPLNACAWTVSGLVSSPLARTLTGIPLRVARPFAVHRLERHRRAGLEARLEVDQVDRLGVRAERLERHRLLHVRAAQLAHPHVNRVLAALEPGAALGARARAPALLAAAGGLAGARALAAADALARPCATRGRASGCAARSAPRALPSGASGVSRPRPSGLLRDLDEMADLVRSCRGSAACPRPRRVWPIRRSPSERSVSRWRLSEPFRDLRCVTFSLLTTRTHSALPLGRRRLGSGRRRRLSSVAALPLVRAETVSAATGSASSRGQARAPG